jgi:hypothetical protein
LPITESIVQSSGTGPLLHIIFASDLKLPSAVDVLCKYADDKTSMIREKSDIYLEDEFEHIMFWTAQNKLKLNLAKTKEMVFHRPPPYNCVDSPLLHNIEPITSFKLLGVFLTNAMFNGHVC